MLFAHSTQPKDALLATGNVQIKRHLKKQFAQKTTLNALWLLFILLHRPILALLTQVLTTKLAVLRQAKVSDWSPAKLLEKTCRYAKPSLLTRFAHKKLKNNLSLASASTNLNALKVNPAHLILTLSTPLTVAFLTLNWEWMN
jgi:hypothetical protein